MTGDAESTGREALLAAEGRFRSSRDQERLQRFERAIYMPLVLSATLPIVAALSRASDDSLVIIAVNIVSWIVFVIDLVVHARLVRRYLTTRAGRWDFVVVVITAPWFLIPGLGGSQILMVARLGRLIRLLFVNERMRRALGQLGRVGVFAVGMLLFCSWVAYVAERDTNPEFATFRDSLWWGIVTLTTVGYGDIVPDTTKGRWAATFLMVTGVASLGVIAGTLSSAFRLTPSRTTDPGADAPGSNDQVLRELTALRQQLEAIERRLPAEDD